eukprot:TRINITY_DN4074_c0_g2_i4.p2 TRINITY_DN4074_c0_g2~~TRINITY_DN4074_c0_g2_i4.p2  ORF type:complete len:138 (+),score=24.98 TRINITY_DN4074_c0_g2_i4:403-816(+)
MACEGVNASLYTKTKPIPWSTSVLTIKSTIEKMFDFSFDYVLMNFYRDGRDYIAFHSDGEALPVGKEIIAGLSLGASRRFLLKKNTSDKNGPDRYEFMLNSGSLLVMAGTTQKYWKHSVPKMLKVKEPRLSLTFRKS